MVGCRACAALPESLRHRRAASACRRTCVLSDRVAGGCDCVLARCHLPDASAGDSRMSAHPLAYLCLAGMLIAGAARAADTTDGSFQSAVRFMEKDGEAVFAHICAGCHMPDVKGAVGAARYPAWAHDSRLSAASYAVLLVTNGRAALPACERV